MHLGDLLRIWVRSGATPPRAPRPDFQGPDGRTPDATPCWRRSSRNQNPLSLQEVSRASAAFGEKITLPGATAGVSGFCRVTATNLATAASCCRLGLATQRANGSAARFRNFSRIPFRPVCDEARQQVTSLPSPLHLGFPLGLRID